MNESTARAERFDLQTSPSSCFLWDVAQKPVAVRIPYRLMDRLEREAIESFRSVTSKGSEIGGLLIGEVASGSPTIVSIAEFQLIECDYSKGPLYRLGDADLARFRQAIEQKPSVSAIAGFFRTQTRKGISLDADDLAVMEALFREPHQIALLVRPFATKASTGAVFIRENGKIVGEASYLEFPFRSPGDASKSSAENDAKPAPAASAGPLPQVPPLAKPAARAQIVPIASRRDTLASPAPIEPKAPAPPPAPAPGISLALPAEILLPPEPRPEAPIEAKPASRLESTLEHKIEPKPVVRPEPPAAPKSELRTAARLEPKPEAKVEPRIESKAEPKVEARQEARVEPKVESKVEPKIEPKVEPKIESRVESKPAPKPETKIETKPAPKPEAKVEPKPAAKPETKPEPVAQAAAPVREIEKTVKPAVEPALPEPASEEAPKSSKGLKLVLAAAAATALFVLLFVYPGLLRHSSKSPGTAATGDTSALQLRVERANGELLVTWNRDAAAIRSATKAVLSINDGEQHENVDMDLAQLRNGSIVYSPQTTDISFKMEVTGKDAEKTMSESVRVLRTRPSALDQSAAAAAGAGKPVPPVQPGPVTPAQTAPAAETTAPAPVPAETIPEPESRPVVATRSFNTQSLSARLRPAQSTDLPDAPVAGVPSASAAVPGVNLNTITATPRPPVAPAPPPPAAVEQKAAPKTGGQIQQAILVWKKDPEYPKLARQTGAKGAVKVAATVGKDGKVKSVRIISGHPMLQAAAREAVMQWVYRPTLLNGQPVETETEIVLNFLGDK